MHSVSFIYNDCNKGIYNKIQKFVEKFHPTGTVKEKLFRMDDLDVINYINNVGKDFEEKDKINSIIDYSTEFKKILVIVILNSI